jgi:hypothetical protein
MTSDELGKPARQDDAHRRPNAVNALGVAGLADTPMGLGPRRHLGRVGDHQDLGLGRPALEPQAHCVRHGAADAGVDLVKDQGLRRAQLAGGDGDRQRNA